MRLYKSFKRFSLDYSTPTITEVALIIAYASLPTAKPNSFTASIEMVEEMMLPLPISMCTIAFTEPVSIDFTVPLSWYRAG